MAALRRGESGAALVTVLVLVVVLTVMGVAMVDLALTEVAVAFGQGDALAAQYIAEAGVARALHELDLNAQWAGVTDTLGDGQYEVSVASAGPVRTIRSTGTRGAGRQVLTAAVRIAPRFTLSAVVGNTTVAVGGPQSGLRLENTFPSAGARAVHANNRLGQATAIAVDPAGAVLIGGVTANGTIAGITCATWPWACDPAAGLLRFPRLDMDSADPASYRSRARTTTDPIDGLNLYFRGGDPASRCMAAGWGFGPRQTQRCWDRYVHDRGGAIGALIANPVFYVEFNTAERTQYALSTLTITHRASRSAGNGGGASTLLIARPAGVVLNDVMVASIAVRGGAGTGITPPVGWTLVPGGANPIDNGTDLRMAVYYKVATAVEPASYTWTFSSSQRASGGIQAYVNVDPADPIDTALGQATLSANNHSTPAVTTSLDGAMLVASFAVASAGGGGNWAPQTPGLAERYDVASTGGPQNLRTASTGTDQLQAAGGATGVKTSRSNNAAPGAAHLLALAPRRITVDCLGLAAGAREALCLRSRPATDSNGVVLYASSVPVQVTGMIGTFRRAGASVAGDINLENLSARTADYAQQSITGDPALVAAGWIRVVSTGAAAFPRSVSVTGVLYAFAGADNPGGGCVPPSTCGDDLLGSGAAGIDVRHGADLVGLTIGGWLMSNGAVTLLDAAANLGSVTVLYDAAAADVLPAAFTPGAVGNVLLPVSWSSND